MTDNDNRSTTAETELDPRFVAAMREALDPGLPQGAGARIANAAWEQSRQGTSPGRRRLRLNRWGWAAVAASLVGAAGLWTIVRAPTPAFAVEGAPVRVWKDGAWVDARRVPVGASVYIADGTSRLVGPDHATIAPERGALLRIVSAGDHVFRVVLRRGSARVDGDSLTVDLGRLLRVQPERGATPSVVAAWLTGDESGEGGGAPPSPDVDSPGVPHVRVLAGRASVMQVSTARRVALMNAQFATLDDVAGLVRGSDWNAEGAAVLVTASVTDGAVPHAACRMPGGGLQIVLRGHDQSFATLVDAGRVQPVAALLNSMTFANACGSFGRVPGATMRFAFSEDLGAFRPLPLPSGPAVTTVERRTEGEHVVVRLYEDGALTVQSKGSASFQAFKDLETARRDAPDLIEPLVPHLRR